MWSPGHIASGVMSCRLRPRGPRTALGQSHSGDRSSGRETLLLTCPAGSQRPTPSISSTWLEDKLGFGPCAGREGLEAQTCHIPCAKSLSKRHGHVCCVRPGGAADGAHLKGGGMEPQRGQTEARLYPGGPTLSPGTPRFPDPKTPPPWHHI